MGKKIEVTVETHELLIIRRPRRAACAWCPACAAEAELVTAEEAAAAAGLSRRTVYRWVEAGRLHFSETPEGWLRVCLKSLLNELNQATNQPDHRAGKA